MVATPLVNVIDVGEPNWMAEPVLSVAVGCQELDEVLAPLNVILALPEKPESGLPVASSLVIVASKV